MNSIFRRILALSGSLLLVTSGGAILYFLLSISHAKAANNANAESLYTCGMHPQVIQNKPGLCPICGMKLTPIRKEAGSSKSTGAGRKIKFYKSTMNPGETSPSPGKDSMGMDMVPVYEDAGAGEGNSMISIDSATAQNMNLRTDVVKTGPVRRTVRTVGVIDFNEAAVTDVTTKFKGWIEKLYVDYTGQQVHRGEPLFEVYSPELYSAQTEYVLAMKEAEGKTGVGAELIKKSALDKLRYFDISEDQIKELDATHQVKKTLRMVAPRDGIVVEKMVVEGQMVDAGMKLYRLADLGTVWVQAQVYEQDLPLVKLGQEATVSLSYLTDRKVRGRVTFIYPTVDEKTRTARVRMEFHNPGFVLKPGMFATVELLAELSPSAVLVPDMAVLRSGAKNTVFVALDGGKFEPRTVTLGPRAEGNYYQVLSGLKEGERVVTSGQFMLDSESQLREAIQKMRGGMGGEGAASERAGMEAPSMLSSSNAPEASRLVYICPMPEHVALEYDHPGKCPICGMTLVPITQETLVRVQPGGQVSYYTCPMIEHNDVREDKPGKCPRCGMTLIPVMELSRPALGQPTNSNSMMPQSMMPTLYTCPMASDADVVSDKPGKCPKCDMDLVPTDTVSHGKTAERHWMEDHPKP